MEHLDTIVTIVAAIGSLGLFAALRSLLKECKELRTKWIEINKDGKITEKELAEFAKEAMDVVSEVIKISYIVKKLLGKSKKKK